MREIGVLGVHGEGGIEKSFVLGVPGTPLWELVVRNGKWNVRKLGGLFGLECEFGVLFCLVNIRVNQYY